MDAQQGFIHNENHKATEWILNKTKVRFELEDTEARWCGLILSFNFC